MEISSLKKDFLKTLFESNSCSLKIELKIVKFISNHKKKYLRSEDELK